MQDSENVVNDFGDYLNNVVDYVFRVDAHITLAVTVKNVFDSSVAPIVVYKAV